ncbi:MAG TPA: vanadium-dependent haloperoxidase [Myxococcales bacterium]|nr:vanadium-dependent haloperoxidase [Myxococcales bacterium]
MKTLLRSGFAAILVCAAARNARAQDLAAGEPDTIRTWNGLARDAVRTAKAADVDAARTYAMVDVAIFDAVNGIVSRGPFGRTPALVPPDGAPVIASLPAAAAAAARAVLAALFPDQAARFDAQFAADLAALDHRPGVDRGAAWGAAVGAQVVAARAADGSRPVETVPAGSGPGVFRAAWSNAQFRNLVPFAVQDPAAFVSPPPPALDSVEYAGALNEVEVLGNAALPDPGLLATFQFWNLAPGTDQPPGEWVGIALEVAGSRRVPFLDEARLLALVSMALADVVAPTFQSKFLYAHWRPATAINEADTDGNPATEADPAWKPRGGGIGGNPQHTSGHSAFSAAAATVLAGFFCRDDVAFAHQNDGAPGGAPRFYTGFSAAALEAGRSRIFGGVHFEFSNQAGLVAGRAVGAEILAGSLLRKAGPTHFGSCPL